MDNVVHRHTVSKTEWLRPPETLAPTTLPSLSLALVANCAKWILAQMCHFVPDGLGLPLIAIGAFRRNIRLNAPLDVLIVGAGARVAVVLAS